MRKVKIAFKIVSEGQYSVVSSILPIIQHMCVHNEFKLENIKEGEKMHLYSTDQFEYLVNTYVQPFSENEKDFRLLSEVVEMLSAYYHEYESEEKDIFDGYPEMIVAILNLFGRQVKEQKVEKSTYYVLEAGEEDFDSIKDIIKEWKDRKIRIS